jgi:hypothetical protein
MKLTITIEMDNAAFDPRELEVARILREVAQQLDDGRQLDDWFPALRDVNGNLCGTVHVD